ncbi:nitrogenase component 1 [Methanosarcina sp. WWM596]|uniref:nitrogenase component 1 n=1 Tax=Methanosarcina sp. WWM596 TaxID=1434103 RepID=UPI000615440C|nr:nitrogenase component 1 [Methanosarcina sp. WWM596]AKB18539.1 Nitrogenase vanadium-cofactor synthesis protein VnfN [Methanosarcina sp. WWM596]
MIFSPDAFTGSILAVEGIRDAAVILNGPTGCKSYHSFLSDRQFPRESSHDPLSFQDEFYFGQPRVPCTCLDGEDYIRGSLEKFESALAAIAAKEKGLLVVINSPGASLVGDDLESVIKKAGIQNRCFVVENTGFSLPAARGFENTALALLEHLKPRPLSRSLPHPVSLKKVNLIGLSLLHKHWEGSVAEMKRLLAFLGLEVGTVFLAGTSLDEIRESRDAACNIVLFPEYGRRVAEWYRERFGTPAVFSPLGAPIGFDANESLLKEVAAVLDIDPARALVEIRKARQTSYKQISRFHSFSGLPKGASFSIRAESSLAFPLTHWLYSYLGMAPLAIKLLPGSDPEAAASLKAFLEEKGFCEAWDRDPALESADIAFADAHTLQLLKSKGCCKAGIEIILPDGGYIHFIPKTYLGVSGTLLLLEEIINGLRST